MKLNSTLEFIRGLPDKGGLVLVDGPEQRADLIQEIHNSVGPREAASVVVALVPRGKQANLVRAGLFARSACFPPMSDVELESVKPERPFIGLPFDLPPPGVAGFVAMPPPRGLAHAIEGGVPHG